MDYTVKVRSYQSHESVLIINMRLARMLNLTRKKRAYVSFGTQKNYVDIKISSEAVKNELLISNKVIENLHIPDYPEYEVRTEGNGIIIGPCIGILFTRGDMDITKKKLREIALSILDYQRINGAIIVFSLDKVDTEKRLIEGYCYNPNDESWERGIFPYPQAIHRRAVLNEKWQNHFLSVIGDNVFNNYSFNKWDMYRWFSSEPGIARNLPDTRIYRTKQDIEVMLERYGVLYIKPIWGMKGYGVVRVKVEDDKINFQYHEDGSNVNISLEDKNEIERTIENLFVPGDFIIQQGLELISYDEGVVDFRFIMQKNEAYDWVCNGMIARIGAKDSVVSNISSGGMAMPAREVIAEALTISEEETFIIKEKMVALCMRVCKAFDQYGFNFGTLGLDLGIDREKNIWLIEVNHRRPHPAMALRANEIPSYYTILAAPLHYAKSLAGFGEKEEGIDVL